MARQHDAPGQRQGKGHGHPCCAATGLRVAAVLDTRPPSMPRAHPPLRAHEFMMTYPKKRSPSETHHEPHVVGHEHMKETARYPFGEARVDQRSDVANDGRIDVLAGVFPG
jgi:hypothetical protein